MRLAHRRPSAVPTHHSRTDSVPTGPGRAAVRSAGPVRRAAPLAATAGVALLLAACSSPDPDPASTGADAAASAEASAETSTATSTTYPLTLDNCGTEVTFDAAPQRVVTVKSSSAETMLALGLGDRIVGAAFLDGPVPEDLADAAAGTAVAEPMSDQVPGTEAVLALEPDLVLAGWESNVSADGAGERDTLHSLGVSTYVSPAACKDPAYMPDPLTFDDVFAEITQAGQVFDVPVAAADLVARQQAELAAVIPDDRGLDALWYSSGTDIPYVGAGLGAPAMIMDAVGLGNVAGDVQDTWTPLGWESVVDADPDVIVLVDAAWNTADSKIEALEANPATATLTAVREGRYLTVPFPATEAGVRNVDAVADLAAQLDALEIDG